MKVISAIIAGVGILIGSIGQAQASKPKAEAKVVVSAPMASATPMATEAGARSTTGRPSNLDPRIPWLEDIGYPQSGGPEPMMPSGTIVIPIPGGFLESFVPLDGNIAMVFSGNIGISGQWAVKVVLTDRDGKVIWIKDLPSEGKWKIVSGGGHLIALPYYESEMDKPAPQYCIVFDMKGNEIKRIAWSFEHGEQRTRFQYSDGIIVTEDSDGTTRKGIRAFPGKAEVDDVLVPNDFMIKGLFENRKAPRGENEDLWNRGFARLTVDRPVYAENSDLRNRRKKRGFIWDGVVIEVGNLPMWSPRQGPVHFWDTFMAVGSGLAFGENKNLWVDFRINNPLHLPSERMYRTQPDQYRGLLAQYSREGRLLSYLILPSSGGTAEFIKTYFGGDCVYVYVITSNIVQRWEPIKK